VLTSDDIIWAAEQLKIFIITSCQLMLKRWTEQACATRSAMIKSDSGTIVFLVNKKNQLV